MQRVKRANVVVGGTTVGAVGQGLLILVGVTHSDDEGSAAKLAGKIAKLRVFPDEDGVMNRSLLDLGAEALVVSQFTLYGDTRKGNRPSWVQAARPEQAEPLVGAVVKQLTELGVVVQTGVFGADMQVELINDGPVTILLEV